MDVERGEEQMLIMDTTNSRPGSCGVLVSGLKSRNDAGQRC